jgi:hypothetical protein
MVLMSGGISARSVRVFVFSGQPDNIRLAFLHGRVATEAARRTTVASQRKEGKPCKAAVIACANRPLHHVHAVLVKGLPCKACQFFMTTFGIPSNSINASKGIDCRSPSWFKRKNL